MLGTENRGEYERDLLRSIPIISKSDAIWQGGNLLESVLGNLYSDEAGASQRAMFNTGVDVFCLGGALIN